MTTTTNQPTESWVFTFGFGHRHPATGERLANRYVKIDGDINETRDIMYRHFGNKWATQYPSEDAAGVEKYGMERIDLL